MRVAVIGAGPSGIVATKELVEAGFAVCCFDQSKDLGGVFRFDEHSNGVYENCRLTSSATTTAFSDFPPRDSSPHQQLHREYLAYLRDYVRHFDLLENFRFGTCVEQVTRMEDGRWRLRLSREGEMNEEEFDAVACCSGLHQKPFVPAELRQFTGGLEHSSSYKRADPYSDKRVLIVGAGESAADIIKEVADVAKSCTLSLRRGVAVLTRMRNGYPTDYFTNRLFYALPRWFVRSIHPRGKVKNWRRATAVLTLPVFLLTMLVVGVTEALIRLRLGARGTPGKIVRKNLELLRMSGGGVGDQFLTKSESFVYSLVDGSCKLRGSIKQIDGLDVTFDDGSSERFDVVLSCTGYSSEVAMFPNVCAGRLFKGCFSPDLGKTVGFIGLVRPAIGAIPPIAEMQARWFAKVLSGRADLPRSGQMAECITADAKQHRASFPNNTDRMPYLVDYTSYMDELAEEIGCKPAISDLIKDPMLLYKFYCAHFMPAQYRLIGEGADAQAASQIKQQVVAYPKVYLPFIAFYLAFAKALNAVGFSHYRPHLSVAMKGKR